MTYVVEPMLPGDIDEVIEIERKAFTSAWSAAAYRRDLEENRMARYFVLRELPESAEEEQPAGETAPPARSGLQRLAEGVKRLVSPSPAPAPRRGRIVGYAGMWLIVDEAHLTTIAVRAGYRGRGFGELLLTKALALASQMGARVLTLEVRVSNIVAQRLYRKYGLQVAGKRRRYYTDNNEDALIMTSEELSSPGFRESFEGLRAANASRTGVFDP